MRRIASRQRWSQITIRSTSAATAATRLGALFRSREVEKIYVAAVAGKPEPPAGTIRFGLVKAGGAGDELGQAEAQREETFNTAQGRNWTNALSEDI